MTPNKTTSKNAYSNMIHRVPIVSPEWSIEKARDYFTKNVTDFESIRYLYVVDHDNKLVGVLSLKDIYRHLKHKTVQEISHKHIISVLPDTHQEKVVYLALKHNIKAIPVLDHQGGFLGVVPSDKILSILYHETREDVLHLAGIHSSELHLDNILEMDALSSLKHRIPWLFVGMIGGILSAKIIGGFESTLQENVLLAAFIPLVVYMSNAVGMQVQALYIRDLASTHRLPMAKYFGKQMGVSFLVSLAMVALFSIILLLGLIPINPGYIVAAAMFFAINFAVFFALVLPYLFKRLQVDPAVGSGPVSTIVQDAMSVVIYFTVASLLL